MLKKIVKMCLPKHAIRWLLGVQAQGQLLMLWFFSRYRWLSSLYYCLFSRQFSREQQAVLLGRLAFVKQQGMQNNSNTLLRRNIHRIEKGLIMQPRKALFALDYIGPTVAAYGAALQESGHDQAELKWATDVLSTYFAVIDLNGLDPTIKQQFDAWVPKQADNTLNSIPYSFANKIQAAITSEAFLALCQQRRSVRWFEQRQVPRVLLEQAVTIASLAPSACNRQPYQFYIADDPQSSQALIAIPLGTKGFAHNVPCTIVVSADLANYPTERDRHLVYIDGALAAMQLMLALETLGLSSCPINWPDIEATEVKMAAYLRLPLTVRPVMLIAVGYGHADGQIPFSQKKAADQLIHYL